MLRDFQEIMHAVGMDKCGKYFSYEICFVKKYVTVEESLSEYISFPYFLYIVRLEIYFLFVIELITGYLKLSVLYESFLLFPISLTLKKKFRVFLLNTWADYIASNK